MITKELLSIGSKTAVEKACKRKAESVTRRGYPTKWYIKDVTDPASGNPPMYEVEGYIEEAFKGAWREE